MRLISLNTWTGKVFEPLRQFIATHAPDTDVFCLQEVSSTTSDRTECDGHRANLLQDVARLLPHHRHFYAPLQDGKSQLGNVNFPLSVGQAMFVRDTIDVNGHDAPFVYRWRNAMEDDFSTIGRALQHARLTSGGNSFAVGNFHGLWNSKGKADTPERLTQSQKILKVLDRYRDAKLVLCGDFNLRPDTESLRLLARGMRNLVAEHDITSTRSSYYTKPEKFADYVLVSPTVEVKRFEVLQDEVSDHLPLLLEFA